MDGHLAQPAETEASPRCKACPSWGAVILPAMRGVGKEVYGERLEVWEPVKLRGEG